MFSSVSVFGHAGEEGLERVREGLEEFADGNQFEADAEVGGEAAAVVDGALRGVGAGHADAHDVFRPEGVGGDGGDQGGVDAAAESDNGLFEAALAHVIAGADDQSAIRRFGVVGGRLGHGVGVAWIDDDQILFKRGGLGDQFAARIQCQRGAVEDEAVVAAHLVGEKHGDPVASSDGGQHLAADFALGVPEGRRRKVDMNGGMLGHDLFHGIDGVELAGPEGLVVPGVFADGDGQAHALEFDHLLGARRRKIALFVEHVVEGQQALVLFEEKLPAIEEHGGIDGRFPCTRAGRQSHARQHGRWQCRAWRRQARRQRSGSGRGNWAFRGSRREDSRRWRVRRKR